MGTVVFPPGIYFIHLFSDITQISTQVSNSSLYEWCISGEVDLSVSQQHRSESQSARSIPPWAQWLVLGWEKGPLKLNLRNPAWELLFTEPRGKNCYWQASFKHEEPCLIMKYSREIVKKKNKKQNLPPKPRFFMTLFIHQINTLPPSRLTVKRLPDSTWKVGTHSGCVTLGWVFTSGQIAEVRRMGNRCFGDRYSLLEPGLPPASLQSHCVTELVLQRKIKELLPERCAMDVGQSETMKVHDNI